MVLFNPVICMLHNTKLNLWHPIIFVEDPLPGEPSPDKPVRHKSKGHHTTGLETKAEALEYLSAEWLPLIENSPRLLTDTDIEWDGEDVPAMVMMFKELQ